MSRSLPARLAVLAVVFLLLVAASLRWALRDDPGGDGPVYIALAVVILAAAAGAHVLAVRHPDRPALEGLAWVLTIIAVMGVGLGSLAMAISPQDSTSPLAP